MLCLEFSIKIRIFQDPRGGGPSIIQCATSFPPSSLGSLHLPVADTLLTKPGILSVLSLEGVVVTLTLRVAVRTAAHAW